MENVKILALAFALAFVVESMVEYIFGRIIQQFPKLEGLRFFLPYLALAAGVGVAFFYRIDLFALILEDVPSWLGVLLSGLGIGRGAEWLHGFVSNYILRRA